MTVTTAPGPRTRCAVHPVRRAVDACPVCARPRCAADASEAPGGGCLACGGGEGPRAKGPGTVEALTRATLASTPVGLLGGIVAAEYVGAGLFGYLTPLVLGVLCGAAAQAAAGVGRTGSAVRLVRAGACLYAVMGTALGFSLEGSQSVFAPRSYLPYLCAVAGAFLWTLPPKAAKPRG